MHATELDVRFSDLDPYGHVNHAVYLTYCEIGRVAALEAVGMPLDRMQRDGFHVPIVEVLVRFEQPAVLGDRLTVTSVLTELRAASARWEQTISRGARTLATAWVRNAITDSDGRPCRGPAGLAEALDALRG
ncbi:acyl-CoA thioesterase [Egibacter rhizosphaerae]|uniref:Acyl-CoA thioesterase n=1 Tax=Egibacter rhizosphaerae TaxID=1670831 RepID=A0A411YFP2_9ACTN|nr:thioesterase family protein [Egibacter rhizosphaerae]QBI20063.1 acyl-CoA thioesterase [Egibacter rhizosphaerae]